MSEDRKSLSDDALTSLRAQREAAATPGGGGDARLAMEGKMAAISAQATREAQARRDAEAKK